MKRAVKYIVYVAVLLCAPCISAQESVFGSASHAIGFSGGGVIGNGLTYRTYLARGYFQGTFFGRVTRQDDITNLMAGVSYGRLLSEIKIAKALAPTALVLVAGIDGQYVKNLMVEGQTFADARVEKTIHTGAGVALEIGNTFSPGLLFTIGTTYALTVQQLDNERQWSIGPQVNVSLLYNW